MKNNRIKVIKNRQKRVRKKLIQNTDRPRLSVFRSNKYIYAQIIDDQRGVTLAAASEKDIFQSARKKGKSSINEKQKLTKLEKASLFNHLLILHNF